jgi:dipeptidyl aminopeptidase/acylaminoacyl peptidase
MARRLFVVAGVLSCFGLGASWLVGSALSRSTNQAVSEAVSPAFDVTIKSSDGLAIAGTFRPGPTDQAPAILLLHGNGGSRDAVTVTADWLTGQGYATLAIDFRGHGESAPADHSFGLFEARDARAAFDWLKQRQRGGRVGVIGISLGGAAALIGDDGPLPTDALVLQAVYPDIRAAIRNRLAGPLGKLVAAVGEPFLSYQSLIRQGVWPQRLSPLTAMARVKGPVLVIGGAADTYTPPTETRALFDATKSEKQLWIVPGLSHVGMSAASNDAYRAKVGAFFAQHLR